MGSAIEDLIAQMRAVIDQASDDKRLAIAFKNMHQGYRQDTLERFLKARDYNVAKATKMLLDCLHWRVNNDIDNILARPIEPKEMNDAIRETQLIGLTGYCKMGRPVFAIGVGHSGFDRASVEKYVQSHIQVNEYRDRILLPEATKRMGQYVGSCLKILDMTGLKLSALNRIKTLTAISTVDDLNYPEKTDTYYIVNAPYIFSACWKVVKPLLQERTKRKIQVLQGCGREELLKVMDYDVLPFFCRYDSKNSSRSPLNAIINSDNTLDCFSSGHPFHVELYCFMKNQACVQKCVGPTPQKSFHVEVPEPDEEIHTIETVVEATLEELSEEGTSENILNGTSMSKMKISEDD